MCELFAISCREPAALTFSLHEFVRHGGGTGPHRDGWGIAFCEGHDARIVREPAAASTSPWARCVEEHPICSKLAISHIRKATFGSRSLANTQPFTRELGGRTHVFAHNGHVPGVRGDARFAPRSFRCIGDTDSEHAFCALLARLASAWLEQDTPPPVAVRQAIVAEFAADLGSHGPANFLYSDGELLFAHGDRRTQASGAVEPPGLWALVRECPSSEPEFATTGLKVVTEGQRLALFASVPLTGEAWRPLREGEVMVVRDGDFLPGASPRLDRYR